MNKNQAESKTVLKAHSTLTNLKTSKKDVKP
jgi:hypothetical protein